MSRPHAKRRPAGTIKPAERSRLAMLTPRSANASITASHVRPKEAATAVPSRGVGATGGNDGWHEVSTPTPNTIATAWNFTIASLGRSEVSHLCERVLLHSHLRVPCPSRWPRHECAYIIPRTADTIIE